MDPSQPVRLVHLISELVRATYGAGALLELAPGQSLILRLIEKAPMNLTELARCVGAEEPFVRQALHSLQRKGLVLPTKSDSRGAAAISALGMTLVKDSPAIALGTLEEVIAPGDRDVEVLLTNVLARLKAGSDRKRQS